MFTQLEQEENTPNPPSFIAQGMIADYDYWTNDVQKNYRHIPEVAEACEVMLGAMTKCFELLTRQDENMMKELKDLGLTKYSESVDSSVVEIPMVMLKALAQTTKNAPMNRSILLSQVGNITNVFLRSCEGKLIPIGSHFEP